MRGPTILIVFLSGLLLGLTVYTLTKSQSVLPPLKKAETNLITETPIIPAEISVSLPIKEPTSNDVNKPLYGSISGSVSYPSEALPPGLKVCAINLENNQEACTDEILEGSRETYVYGFGYKLELFPGKYYVYSFVEGRPDYKAYYSEFVTCGLSIDCPSHKPIEVSVVENIALEKIDPTDWYAEN